MRKKYLIVALLSVLAFPAFSQLIQQIQQMQPAQAANTPIPCLMEVTPKQVAMEMARDQEAYELLRQSLLNNAPETTREFVIQLHLLQNDNGTNGGSVPTIAQIRSEFTNFVNPYFNTATLNAKFVECGPEMIHSSTAYNSLSSYAEGEAMSQAYSTANVINIYFVEYAQGACGWARFPADLPEDYIVILYDCATNQSTLVHELGHYFDTYHTHETAFGAENVTRNTTNTCYNAATTGDLLHDTPADPRLNQSGISISAAPACLITSMSKVDNCGSGVTYTPDPTNIMSYSLKACRTIFTSGQQTRMAAAMVGDRSYLNSAGCPAPIANCKPATIQLNASGTASLTASAVDNGSTVSFGSPILSVSPNTFNCGNIGSNTATLTVTDVYGKTSTCATTVTVTDGIKPVIICPPTAYLNTDLGQCSSTASIGVATATDNCAGVVITGPVPAGPYAVGTTLVTWTATDASNNVATCTQNVVVIDNEPPAITCPATANLNTDLGLCSSTASIGVATATDNCVGVVVTGPVPAGPYPVGTTSVTWTATDAANNTVTCTQNVVVIDTEAPTAIASAFSVTLFGGLAGITAANVEGGSFDNCDIDFDKSEVSPSSFDCSQLGANSVTLKVFDVNGNSNTATTTVTVIGEIPSCTITSLPNSNVFTGGVSTTLYLGYGAQSTTLEVAAIGGSSFTYSWSGNTSLLTNYLNSPNPEFTPIAAGSETFTVLVTNEYGCTTICSITIDVVDARCKNNKVLVCHNDKEICINTNSVAMHLSNHGNDYLGPCSSSSKIALNEDELTIIASPSPFAYDFALDISSGSDALVQISIFDMTGNLLEKLENVDPHEIPRMGSKLANGLYFVTVNQQWLTQSIKIVKRN